MAKNTALLFYEQAGRYLASDTPPTREAVAGAIDSLTQQYFKAVAEIGSEVIAAASAEGKEKFYTATVTAHGRVGAERSPVEKLPFLLALADTQFAPGEVKSEKVISFYAQSDVFDQYWKILSRNFDCGRTGGSRYPLQLKGVVEANSHKVSCDINLWKWNNCLPDDKPSGKKDALAVKLISLAGDMQSVAGQLGLESFGNPMNGLSVEDHIRLKGEALSGRYNFGFSYDGNQVRGYDLRITSLNERRDLSALVRRLLFHDLLGGGKIVPPLSLSTLFLLRGMGNALHQRQNSKAESEPVREIVAL